MSDNPWHKVQSPDGYYSVYRLGFDGGGMDAIRSIFPSAECDRDNLILFSTSGVHGHYGTIEEAEDEIKNGCKPFAACASVTFLIIKPRQVVIQFGNVYPETPEEFEYLKKLRASAKSIRAEIGE